MSELEISSNRKLPLKIEAFTIKSEDSPKESNSSKKIKTFKSKSVNIFSEEEKIEKMNININIKA